MVKNTNDFAVNATSLMIFKPFCIKNILATMLEMTTAMPRKFFQHFFNVFHWSIVRFWFANTFKNFTKFTNHMSIWTNVTIFPNARTSWNQIIRASKTFKNQSTYLFFWLLQNTNRAKKNDQNRNFMRNYSIKISFGPDCF